jgi:hypothetical protein
VQIKLTNRSHCQVADATVTIEQYNESRKRWEAMDQPRLRFFRRPGEPEPKPLVWEVAGSVDAGHVVLTDSITLNDRVLRAVERRQCRLVLHATPVVRSLPPSRRPPPAGQGRRAGPSRRTVTGHTGRTPNNVQQTRRRFPAMPPRALP